MGRENHIDMNTKAAPVKSTEWGQALSTALSSEIFAFMIIKKLGWAKFDQQIQCKASDKHRSLLD